MHLCYRISHILFPHLDLHRGDTMWNEALVQLAGIVCFDKQLWWCGKRLSAWSPRLKLDNMTSLTQPCAGVMSFVASALAMMALCCTMRSFLWRCEDCVKIVWRLVYVRDGGGIITTVIRDCRKLFGGGTEKGRSCVYLILAQWKVVYICWESSERVFQIILIPD